MLIVEGQNLRQEHEMQRLAWHACTIVNVWLPRGKRIKPSDLIGKSEAPAFLDKQSLRKYMQDRITKG